MTDSQYSEALQRAVSERDEWVAKRSECDQRIALLTRTIDALSALSGTTADSKGLPQENLDDVGITEAIRTILSQSVMPMTAPQIRDALIDRGYDTDRYASILTVIHNTVKRMYEQGEILIANTDSGRFLGWRYVEPSKTMPEYVAQHLRRNRLPFPKRSDD